jgi:hypothetical protein
LTFQSVLAAIALLAAVVALLKARRAARRLERLTESYWELKYECGQLRSRLARLEPPEQSAADGAARNPAASQSFVPLSSLKMPR